MSVVTFDYIEESQVEADFLIKLLAIGAVSNVVISAHVFSMWWMSKTFKRDVLKDVKSINELMDEDGRMVERLEVIQQRIKDVYHKLSSVRTTGPLLKLNCFMLKKSFNNFTSIIININEHDADVDIDNGNVSGPFNSVEDMINHLNA